MQQTDYSQNNTDLINKLLKDPGIDINQWTNNKPHEDTLVLKENTLCCILNGRYNFRHGNLSYCAKKQHSLFLRKNVSITYKAEDESAACLVVPLNNETVLEFVQMARPSIRYSATLEAIVVTEASMHLFNYLSS